MPSKFLLVSFNIFEYHFIIFLFQNDVVLLFFSFFLNFLDRPFQLILLCRTNYYQLHFLKQLTSLAFLVPCKVSTNLELLNTLCPLLYYLPCCWGTKNYPVLFPLFSKGAIRTKPESLHLYMKSHSVRFSLQTWLEFKSLLKLPHFFI